MPLTTEDIVPITTARAKLTELAEQVARTGQGKVLTRNGESYVAIVTASDFDRLQEMRREENLSILRAVAEGLEDVNAGRTMTWEEYQPELMALRHKVRAHFGMPALVVHEPAARYEVGQPAARRGKVVSKATKPRRA